MMKEILEGLIKVLGPIATLSKERRELKDSALRAIVNALDETALYYRDYSNGQRNLDRESLLAKYWSAAAIPMRHIDSELAQRCDFKSEYWTNPSNYSDSDIDNLNIELDSVRTAYRNLLQPRFKTGGRR